jgi:exonuclease III
MIIVSYNVRGLGGRVKKRRVCDLVQECKVDFLALQETKLEEVSESLCYRLWGSSDCNWFYLPSEGASGGILSIWGKSNSNLICTFNGEGYVGVCLEWGVQKSICFVINVYSKSDLVAKRRLWGSILSSKRQFGSGNWCVVGDFNAVVSSEERRGMTLESSFNVEMRDFRGFIVDSELIDLSLLGRRFTWYHGMVG